MGYGNVVGVKISEPVRGQVEVKWGAVDAELPAEHIARALDTIVGSLNLAPFLARAKSAEGAAGRPILSPRMMLVLWLYAIIDGVGSAMAIERLTTTHVAYRWIVGDLRPSHDAISRFRVHQGEAFSAVLSDLLARLLEAGLLDLDVVGQDGTRLRASAGAPSFRSALALEECREHARLHLEAVLSQQLDPELSPTVKATRLAKARDYVARVERAVQALATLPEDRKGEPRASTTDPDARVMKMGDGGFRPAYNVQFSVAGSEEGGPRTIVGVNVTNVGSDMGSLTPMADDVEARTGERPKKVLADTNHFNLKDMAECKKRGTTPIVPPPRPRKKAGQSEKDRPSVDEWRDAKMSIGDRERYKRRPSLSELANAALKGTYRLDQLRVRGLRSVTSTIFLYALAFDIHQNINKLTELVSM